MRFGQGGFACAQGFGLNEEADIRVAARHLAVGQGGQIQRLQQADGVGEVWVQRGVAGGVGDGVGDHVLQDGTKKGRLKIKPQGVAKPIRSSRCLAGRQIRLQYRRHHLR